MADFLARRGNVGGKPAVSKVPIGPRCRIVRRKSNIQPSRSTGWFKGGPRVTGIYGGEAGGWKGNCYSDGCEAEKGSYKLALVILTVTRVKHATGICEPHWSVVPLGA